MNERLYAELDYCVPLGIPHSVFLTWSELDQDKAMAYQAEMRTVCKGCGTRKSEWDADPDAYVGDLVTCEGCTRLAEEEDNMPEDKTRRRGMRPRLVTKAFAMFQAQKLADADMPEEGAA